MAPRMTETTSRITLVCVNIIPKRETRSLRIWWHASTSTRARSRVPSRSIAGSWTSSPNLLRSSPNLLFTPSQSHTHTHTHTHTLIYTRTLIDTHTHTLMAEQSYSGVKCRQLGQPCLDRCSRAHTWLARVLFCRPFVHLFFSPYIIICHSSCASSCFLPPLVPRLLFLLRSSACPDLTLILSPLSMLHT